MLETHSKGSSRVNFTQMEDTYGSTEQNIYMAVNPLSDLEQSNNLKVETEKGSLTVLDTLTATI